MLDPGSDHTETPDPNQLENEYGSATLPTMGRQMHVGKCPTVIRPPPLSSFVNVMVRIFNVLMPTFREYVGKYEDYFK